MRTLLLLIVTLNSLLVATAQTTTNWSNRIVCRERHPLRYWVSLCGEAVSELRVDGKHFEHVRGYNRFYLQVPHTNMIVFVVDEKDYSVTYHIYNMDTREDIAISARESSFGQTIGEAHSEDAIEDSGNGNILLSRCEHGGKSTLPSLANMDSIKFLYHLNLHTRSIVAEETLFYDKTGKVILKRDASPFF